MNDTHSNQSRAQAGGDIAGRDIITNVVLPARPSPLHAMLARIDQRREDDPELDTFIDELQCFIDPVDPSTPIGLEKKLTDGSRQDLIPQAMREKELVAKTLTLYQHSRSAQKVYGYLLGAIRDQFKRHITPLICDGATIEQIDAAIVEHIVEPCTAELLHNPLEISPAHLHGMIYFLTGNCYLRWHRTNA